MIPRGPYRDSSSASDASQRTDVIVKSGVIKSPLRNIPVRPGQVKISAGRVKDTSSPQPNSKREMTMFQLTNTRDEELERRLRLEAELDYRKRYAQLYPPRDQPTHTQVKSNIASVKKLLEGIDRSDDAVESSLWPEHELIDSFDKNMKHLNSALSSQQPDKIPTDQQEDTHSITEFDLTQSFPPAEPMSRPPAEPMSRLPNEPMSRPPTEPISRPATSTEFDFRQIRQPTPPEQSSSFDLTQSLAPHQDEPTELLDQIQSLREPRRQRTPEPHLHRAVSEQEDVGMFDFTAALEITNPPTPHLPLDVSQSTPGLEQQNQQEFFLPEIITEVKDSINEVDSEKTLMDFTDRMNQPIKIPTEPPLSKPSSKYNLQGIFSVRDSNDMFEESLKRLQSKFDTKSVQSNIKESVQSNITKSVQSNMRGSVQSNMRGSVQSNMRESVQSNMRESVHSNIRESVQSNIKQPKGTYTIIHHSPQSRSPEIHINYPQPTFVLPLISAGALIPPQLQLTHTSPHVRVNSAPTQGHARQEPPLDRGSTFQDTSRPQDNRSLQPTHTASHMHTSQQMNRSTPPQSRNSMSRLRPMGRPGGYREILRSLIYPSDDPESFDARLFREPENPDQGIVMEPAMEIAVQTDKIFQVESSLNININPNRFEKSVETEGTVVVLNSQHGNSISDPFEPEKGTAFREDVVDAISGKSLEYAPSIRKRMEFSTDNIPEGGPIPSLKDPVFTSLLRDSITVARPTSSHMSTEAYKNEGSLMRAVVEATEAAHDSVFQTAVKEITVNQGLKSFRILTYQFQVSEVREGYSSFSVGFKSSPKFLGKTGMLQQVVQDTLIPYDVARQESSGFTKPPLAITCNMNKKIPSLKAGDVVTVMCIVDPACFVVRVNGRRLHDEPVDSAAFNNSKHMLWYPWIDLHLGNIKAISPI